MKQSEGNEKWSKNSHSYFERFAAELEEYTKTHILPNTGSQDVQHYLELQQRRLQDRGLKMVYNITPRGHFADGGGPAKGWSDNHYINQMECRTCNLSRTFLREGKVIYKKGQNEILYQTITNVKEGNMVGDDLYTCPNCGAVSKIKELREGCPYCGTFFEMKDLFPKVTNYFTVKDFGGTEKEVKSDIFKFILPFMIVAIIGYSGAFFWQSKKLILALIQGIIAGCIGGGIMGYLVWAFKMLGSLFVGAGKSIGALANSSGSGKRFVNIMRQHSPEFSYEYFTGKVVSLTKMITYARNAQELPNYVGNPLGDMFSDIVESSYYGAVALKNCQVKDNYAHVNVEVYMENLCDENGKLNHKSEKIRIQLSKRIDKAIDYNFSIKKIQCKSCGASFDATKQRTCPHCGNRYEIGDDDWVVLKIER